LLARLKDSDLGFILQWRNAPAVRQAMFTQHEISWEEHEVWFHRVQADESKRWFLYLNKNNQPSGVVYFTVLDPAQHSAFWGFYASPDATPGTGLRMSLDALDKAFNELALEKLNVDVLVTNSRSLDMHKKIGFAEEGHFREQFFNGEQRIDVVRLGMLASEWSGYRQALKARIAQLDAFAAQREAAPPRTFSIVILSDEHSWINRALMDLVMDWSESGHVVHWAHSAADLPASDFCFCLSFGQLLPSNIRQQFKHTLVVHESDLPAGKGWSPLTWQILEGKNRIPVTLFEAADEVDSGPIYAQRWISFDGHELVDELREGQARATREICQWFVDHYPESLSEAREQRGCESFYPRRLAQDSLLDPNKTITEQFNLLRVVDNKRYPALINYMGCEYSIKIIKKESV